MGFWVWVLTTPMAKVREEVRKAKYSRGVASAVAKSS